MDGTVRGWELLLRLLRDAPQARLNAVDDLGLFRPLPPDWAALGHAQLPGVSGIESVATPDQAGVIMAWLRAREEAYAYADVEERTAPGRTTRMHWVDLRESYGLLACIAHVVADSPPHPTDEAPRERTRVGRLRKNAQSQVLEVDAATEALLGYDAASLVGSTTRELVHPDDRPLAVTAWVEMLAAPGSSRCTRMRHRRSDGSWLWLDVVNHNRLNEPEHMCVVSDLVDVSAEMAYRDDARAGERLLQRLAQALPVGLLQVSPRGDVVYANDRLHRLLGVPPQPTLAGQLASLRPDDRDRVLAALDAGADADLQVLVDHPDGRRVFTLSLRPLVGEDGSPEGVLVCVTDVTESTELRAQLEERATYDELTGCLNRAALVSRLRQRLTEVRPGQGCAVLFLDLDRFKAINDTAGHAAGDEALRRTAEALRSVARLGDAVGRLGGDEFVLVCPGVGSEQVARELACGVRRRLAATPIAASPGAALLRASIGVTWTDDRELCADEVLRRADAAMYAAKSGHRREPVLWTA